MSMRINKSTVHNPAQLIRLLEAFDAEIDALRALANELKTDMNEHVHGGVTAGAANTAAGATISAATVVEQVESGN